MHKKTQQEELKIIQQKTGIIIGNLTALHQLTKDRVAASNGDAERIQNILSSTPRLYAPQELPKIKRLSYYKHSFPQLIITRFGSLPLDAGPLPRVRASERETEITFHQNIILSKTPVLDVKGNPEGILEVLITPLDFRASLGDLRTLSFYPTPSTQEEKNYLLQKEPFALYAKWPDHFWKFAFLHKERYAVFLFYTLLFLFLSAIWTFYINRQIRKGYGDNLEFLKASLSKSMLVEKKAKEDFIAYELKHKNHQISYQSYKNLHAILGARQKEQVQHICQSLNVVREALENPNIGLLPEHQLEIIRSCLKSANLLSNGLVSNTKMIPINLKNLFVETQSLFMEKIYKSKITLDLFCSDKLTFYGDSLFTELLLMNMIGKAIHRVSKNGQISVIVTGKNDCIHLEIQDNGFSLADSSEKLLKKSFPFFIEEEIFQEMCQINGLKYEYLRTDNSLNITKLIILNNLSDSLQSNIVQLFK